MNLVTPKGGAKHELLFNMQTLISTQPCMLAIEITVISIMPTHAASSEQAASVCLTLHYT